MPLNISHFFQFEFNQFSYLLCFHFLRDGPDTSSPQLGVFSGNTALESAYSSSSKVLIRFHSDFSTGGFFILNFHGNSILQNVNMRL